MKLALRLDPLSLRTNITYENHLLEAKRYQEAVDHGLTLAKLYPENAAVHQLLATAYEQTGRLEMAGQEFDKFLAGNETGRSLRAACQRLSYPQCKQQFNKIEANKELIDLEQKHKKGHYTSPADFAQAYLQLGEKRKAIQWLESAYEDRCTIMLSLALPQFDEVRSEPAFQDLEAKVALLRAVQ
jgi:tetratricopeptide (TPR) repeat protein